MAPIRGGALTPFRYGATGGVVDALSMRSPRIAPFVGLIFARHTSPSPAFPSLAPSCAGHNAWPVLGGQRRAARCGTPATARGARATWAGTIGSLTKEDRIGTPRASPEMPRGGRP